MVIEPNIGDQPDDQYQRFLSVGTMVHHYRIIERIGAGGMGEVYLAKDTELGRDVALKFLPLQYIADENYKARFRREAQAIAALKHNNIITIHAVKDWHGRPFIDMEFIDGPSLSALISREQLGFEKIVELSIQICEGLSRAHQESIIHRDLKPSNILINNEGQVKIVDFGLAMVKGDERLTRTGSTMGTVAYMSPEQALALKIDHRSDIFSLGVVLYEMVTGKLPFHGEYEAIMLYSIAHEPAEPLLSNRPDTPGELQRIIDKSLEKDRDTRYQSCKEIIADLKKLNRILTGETAQPTQSGSAILPGKISLAVMYFEDFTGDEGIKWLSRGLPHMLITNLEQSKYLDVIGYQRLFDILRMLGKENTTQIDATIATEVCQKAGAMTMVLGAIFRTPNKIRIDYTVQDVHSGKLIHAGRVMGKEPFSLAEELGNQIRLKLDIDPAKDHPTKSSGPSPDAYRYYLDGLECYYKLYWEDAVSNFEKAIKYDPKFALAYYGLALLKLEMDSPEKAELIAKAIKFSEKLPQKEKRYINSVAAIIAGDFEKAKDELIKIIARYADEKTAAFWLGFIYRTKLHQPDKAIEYFLKAIELDPHFGPALNELVYAYDQIGDFEKSIWAVNKYIEAAPDEANPHDTKGDLYASNGQLEKAIESYRKAVEIKPDFYMAIQKLGTMYIFKRDYPNAQDCFRQLSVCGLKDRRSEGRTCLAWIPLCQGKFKQALNVLDDGLGADRIEHFEEAQNANKHYFKASIYSELKDWPKALEEVEKGTEVWHKTFPQDPIYGRHYHTQLRAESGDIEGAEKLAALIKIDIDKTNPIFTPWHNYATACIARAKGDFEEAFSNLSKAAQSVPHYYIHFMLAKSGLETNRLDIAVTEFTRLQSVYDNARLAWLIWAVKSHYYLGCAYEKSGWGAKAIEQYSKFLDIWKEADAGIIEIADCKARLAQLTVK
jgi:serine/threonine protein kinase/tetratricopeptide (TPR) repeat protein